MPFLKMALYFEKCSGRYALIVDGKHVGSFADILVLKDRLDDAVNLYVHQQELVL